MIYELRNKIPRNASFLTSEDVLTSTIFGNLRYFNDQSILINFLNEAIAINGDTLTIEQGNIFDIKFWEKYYLSNNHKYNEPDLHVSNTQYDIIIECKYYSTLGEEITSLDDNKDAYSNQLIRYSKIIEKSKKRKIIIYLTNDERIPTTIITDSLERINVNIRLYWLSWRKLYRVMNELAHTKLNYGERQLFNDLLLFLKKRNMTMFCGFRVQHKKANWKYIKRYTYIPKGFGNYSFWRYSNEK